MQRVLEDLSLPVGCLVVPGEWLHVSKARRWTSRGSCGHLLLLEVVKLSPTQERAENRSTGRNIVSHTNQDTRRTIPRAVWFGLDSVGVASTNHSRVGPTSKPGLIKTTWREVSFGLHHCLDNICKHFLIDGMHYVVSRLKVTSQSLLPQGRVSAGAQLNLQS